MANHIGLELAGQKFSRWLVLEKGDLDHRGNVLWLCRCDCGTERFVRGSEIYLGNSTSCGCTRRRHGMTKTRTFKSWDSMKQRCLNPNSPDYSRYGGLGITVCERWLSSFENFLADMGERPDGKSLDRIDNDGNYEPSNCRWATASEQQFNKKANLKLEYQGQIRSIVDLSSESGVPLKILRWRLDNGWNTARAIETPVRIKS
jgi:hypothetical protein